MRDISIDDGHEFTWMIMMMKVKMIMMSNE